MTSDVATLARIRHARGAPLIVDAAWGAAFGFNDRLDFEMAMPAPEAFAAEAEPVAYEDAAGRIAAEIIAPAPPGIPRLIPGQRITPAHVAYLVANRDAGVFILDPADPSQRRLRVVKAC